MPLSLLNPWVIVGLVAALLTFGLAGYWKGGSDNEARHVKLELAATKQVLADFTTNVQTMNGIANQFTGISADLSSQIGDISRKFRNGTRQNPLPADCKPDTFRMQSLSSAIGAANSAAGRSTSAAVPDAK
jgi:hypothetical protein